MEKTTKKRFLNKITIQIIWFFYSLCSIALVLYLIDHMLSKEITDKEKRLILEDGWTVLINDTQYEDVILEELRFKPMNKGDRIVLTKTLPEEWKFKRPALCLHIRQTTVDMFVDGQRVYDYGHERLKNNYTIGSGIQIIDFSNDYKGKELKIVLEVSEKYAFSKMDEMWISEWSDSYRLILAENRLAFFLGAFLVVFGIVVTTILVFVVAKSPQYTNILLISVFAICMGIWTLCYHNIILLFPVPLYTATLIEYMALFLAPLPIIGYMYGYVKQLESKRLMVCYRILFCLQFVITALSITLHALDIVHAAGMLFLHHILYVMHSIFFVYILSAGTKKSKARRKLYTIGLVIVLVSIAYEMVNYISNRYLGWNVLEGNSVLPLGIIVFIAIMILDLYHDITIRKMEEHERMLLIKRANTDDLTQLNNRRFCTEYMKELDTDEESKYTIVSFDLNDLKKSNDQYGHVQGDLLIKRAAELIGDIFSDSGIVGRIGGDEFIAILSTEDTTYVEALLEQLRQRIDETNRSMPELNLSISYGYAMRSEIEENIPEKVYQLSDNRMYEYKRIYKQQREG